MDHEHEADLRKQRAVTAPEWVTPVEAAFVARVPVSDVTAWVEFGRVEHRTIGSGATAMLVRTIDVMDAAERRAEGKPTLEPPRPPVEALPPSERPRVRSRRLPSIRAIVAGGVVLAVLAGSAVLALVGPRWLSGEPRAAIVVPATAAARLAGVSQDVVGRNPFASPFAVSGGGRVIVKPPVAIRRGSTLSAAAVVVNRSEDEALPPTELLFVAHDATGKVVGQRSTVVSLEPGRTTTVVAEGIGIGTAGSVTLEAKLTRTPVREDGGRERRRVKILGVRPTESGDAVTGRIKTRSGGASLQVGCALFDATGELAAVGVTRLRPGQKVFSIPTRPVRSGPYDASCFVG